MFINSSNSLDNLFCHHSGTQELSGWTEGSRAVVVRSNSTVVWQSQLPVLIALSTLQTLQRYSTPSSTSQRVLVTTPPSLTNHFTHSRSKYVTIFRIVFFNTWCLECIIIWSCHHPCPTTTVFQHFISSSSAILQLIISSGTNQISCLTTFLTDLPLSRVTQVSSVWIRTSHQCEGGTEDEADTEHQKILRGEWFLQLSLWINQERKRWFVSWWSGEETETKRAEQSGCREVQKQEKEGDWEVVQWKRGCTNAECKVQRWYPAPGGWA